MIAPIQNYRLGDLIYGWMDKHHRSDKYYPNSTQYCKHWINTLGCKFIHTCISGDFTCFTHIVEKQNENVSFLPSNILIIHLRLGDVLDLPYYQTNKRFTRYVRPLSFYRTLQFPKTVDCAHVVTNTSFRTYYGANNSRQHLSNVLTILKERGLRTRMIHHNSADEDFLYMTRSKFFVPSGGGFSSLVSRIVHHYNGTVIK